jgi:hypothetical protein
MTAASGLGPRDKNSGRDGGRDNDRDRDREREREREREVKDTAPARDTRDREPVREAAPVEAAHRAPRAAGRSTGAIVAALLVGLLLGGAAAAFFTSQDDDAGSGDPFAGVIDSSRSQAVILSNDKVYFGKLSDASDEFYELDEAFFLRETRESADAEPVRALLPVNREIHAPDNTMLIRKSEVVLVENLAKDSPILTEIKRQLGDGK